jgi:hypothetical protein
VGKPSLVGDLVAHLCAPAYLRVAGLLGVCCCPDSPAEHVERMSAYDDFAGHETIMYALQSSAFRSVSKGTLAPAHRQSPSRCYALISRRSPSRLCKGQIKSCMPPGNHWRLQNAFPGALAGKDHHGPGGRVRGTLPACAGGQHSTHFATTPMQVNAPLPLAVDIASLQRGLQECAIERGFAENVLDAGSWCSTAMLTRAVGLPCDPAGSASQTVQQSQWTSLRQGANRSSSNRSMTTIVPSRAFVTGVGHTSRRQKSAPYLQALRLARCIELLMNCACG